MWCMTIMLLWTSRQCHWSTLWFDDAVNSKFEGKSWSSGQEEGVAPFASSIFLIITITHHHRLINSNCNEAANKTKGMAIMLAIVLEAVLAKVLAIAIAMAMVMARQWKWQKRNRWLRPVSLLVLAIAKAMAMAIMMAKAKAMAMAKLETDDSFGVLADKQLMLGRRRLDSRR